MYTACFFGFYFILFNDVDIPQVALLSAFFALAQKDKKDKLTINKCLWIQCFMLIFLMPFLLQQNASMLELLYFSREHFYINKHIDHPKCTICQT